MHNVSQQSGMSFDSCSSSALPEILLFFFIWVNAATALMTLNMVPVLNRKPPKLWTQYGYSMHHTTLRQAGVHLMLAMAF